MTVGLLLAGISFVCAAVLQFEIDVSLCLDIENEYGGLRKVFVSRQVKKKLFSSPKINNKFRCEKLLHYTQGLIGRSRKLFRFKY